MLFSTKFLSPEGGEGGGEGTSAPQMITVKGADGADLSIPRPAGWFNQQEVAEKYVPKASHNDQMARMRTQYDAVKGNKTADELLSDEEFRTKATQHWGLNPDANKQMQTQLANVRTEMNEREVKPRETKIGDLTKKVDTLRQKDLVGQIVRAAAESKVAEQFLKSPTKGGTPLIVAMLRDGYAFDEENGEWFAKGATGGYAFSQSGTTPYMTVSEHISTWLASPEGKDFVRSERQSGAESRPQQGQGGVMGKELRITQAQVRDIPTFRQLQAKADKEGLSIRVVDGQ